MSISPKSPLKSALLGLTAAGIVAFAISALAAGPGTPSTSQQIQSDNSKQEENMPAAPAKKADGSSAKASMQSPAKQNMNRAAAADMPAEATEADKDSAASKSATQNMARPGQSTNRSAAAGMPADTTETDKDKKDAAGKNATQAAARPGQSTNRSAAAGMPAAAMCDDATATDKDKDAAASKSAAQNMARPGQSTNRSAAAGMPAPSATAEEQQAPQSSMPASQPGMNRSTGRKQQEMRSTATQSSTSATMREANAPATTPEKAQSNPQAAQQQPGMTARSTSTADNGMPASQMQQRADETCPVCGGAAPCPTHPAPMPSK